VRIPRDSLEADKRTFKKPREFPEGDKLCRSGQGFLGGLLSFFVVLDRAQTGSASGWRGFLSMDADGYGF
jgi:hypothetical protein